MKYLKLLFAFTLVCCMAPLAYAHNHLESTMPESGASLDSNPQTVEIHYSDPTWLIACALENDNGDAVEIDYELPAQSSAVFSIPMPELASGAYTFSWTVEGDDTHRLEGEITFSVE